MSFKMQRIHVFHTLVKDEPGGIAGKLKPLADAGTHLEYVYSQRSPNNPEMGDLYVGPINNPQQVEMAKSLGMQHVNDPIVMRVEGTDTTGLAGRLTIEWASANISLSGLVMTSFQNYFVGYATFQSVDDANKAATILAELGTAG